jgi:hypothetical protein
MLCRVALVRNDVSEELSASFIRVTSIGELGTTLAVSSNRRTLRRNTKYIPEDTILNSHSRENLKSYVKYIVCVRVMNLAVNFKSLQSDNVSVQKLRNNFL